MTKERIMFSVTELILWDAIEDSAELGSRQWWFARLQGRFYNYFLYAN